MLEAPDHKTKRHLFLGVVLLVDSLAVSGTLTGCGAWTTSDSPENSTTTQFGYTGSQLASTLVPVNAPTPISGAYFGMTIHRLVYNPLSPSMPIAPFPTFPLHTLRLWDVVNWSSLEPVEGQYDWTVMDGTIAVAKQNGVSDFIFTLGEVPPWAYANPGETCGSGATAGPCMAPDPRALDEFVTQVVQRYCGVVKYYETWNEPNWGFWNGSNAQLLAVSAQLYQIAKDPANCGCTNEVCSPGGGSNPNQVLLPSISSIQGNLGWLDSYLSTAGSKYPYADISAFHGYECTQPEQIATDVGQLRNVLAKHGLSALELWDTEGSWGNTVANDQEQEASWLMRFHIVQQLSGVSRFVWYAYDNCDWGTLWGAACGNSPDSWQGVRLPGDAYATLETWLTGATLTHCDQYQDGLWACELQRSGGYEGWILWDSTRAALSVPVPKQLQLKEYHDWRNNVSPLSQQITIDEMPMLLDNASSND
jgi:hypothetical protein